MFTSKSVDHLAFVSRQLSNLLVDEEIEPALRRLADAAPAQYSADIEILRNLLSGSAETAPSLGRNPYTSMAKLLPAVTGSTTTFFRKFVEYVQQSKVIFETYWAGVVGLVWYLAALSLVALIVAVVFGFYVVPTFTRMFSQFSAPLPELTTTVFAFGGAGIPLFAIALTVIVATVVWFVVLFHGRIRRLAPLPRWPTWAPIIGGISESYNLGLFLNFVRILRESDVDRTRAVAEAANAANQSPSLSYASLQNDAEDFEHFTVLTELAVAAKLGHFDSEIVHQCDQHIGRMSLALVEARDRFSLLLKLVLYVFVATLVVAMYLPIFRMGSII